VTFGDVRALDWTALDGDDKTASEIVTSDKLELCSGSMFRVEQGASGHVKNKKIK
jgi:hypothetical protein